jgi:hypothetical protein
LLDIFSNFLERFLFKLDVLCFQLVQRKASPLPDAAQLVRITIAVVVRVAIIQVHVPSIRTAVLRKRPKVIGRLNFPLPTFFNTIFHLKQIE